MQALFMDTQGRISIHDRAVCPALLTGLVRKFVRTGTDSRHGFVYYEEESWFVRSLAIAHEKLLGITA